MGVSSGWNVVARRPSRLHVVPKPKPARHLVIVPPLAASHDAGHGPEERGPEPHGPLQAPDTRDCG